MNLRFSFDPTQNGGEKGCFKILQQFQWFRKIHELLKM